MKKLLTICLVMATIFVVKAQAHISTGKYVCNLVPKSRGTEKYLCPACEKIDEKERIARKAEDKKRSDANDAKILADKKAAEALKLEKQRLAKVEEQRKKAKEIADKIANENASRRYKEIASKGIMKSSVKGKDLDVDLSKVESFVDDKRKVYGFKLNDEEVMTFPFEGKDVSIDRVKGSNLFIVREENYSYLIDITGKRIIVDGNDKTTYWGIYKNATNNVIYFEKNHSIDKTGQRVDGIGNSAFGKYYKTKESAMADVDYYESRRSKGGLVSLSSVALWFNTRYTLDNSGNILEKSDGYLVTRY